MGNHMTSEEIMHSYQRSRSPEYSPDSHFINGVGNCDFLTDSTKAVVSIKPDKQVFKGEAVTLRCDTQAGGDTEWTYSWYKDDHLSPNRRTQEFTISSVTESNGGKYTCRGERKHDSQSSEISDAVTLTVSDVAQAVLSVSPQSWLTEGDSVTLSCEVTGSSTGWTFSWYRAVLYRQGLQQIRDIHGNVLYHVELLSDSRREAGGSFTLSPAALNHTGVYVCRAERGEPAYQTQYSTAQTLWITGSSPPASLIISPSRTQHFSAGSLSLSCEGLSDSTGWRVRRYTHSGEVSDCSSVTGSTCKISSLYTSLTGVYWCQSESGGGSDPLNITVHNSDVILDSPVHPVSERDSLTLRCLYHSTKPSNLTADFYKDGSLLQTQTTGEMIIRTISKSDEGLYHCKHPEKGESPKSWLSVRASGSGSDGVTVRVAVGVSAGLSLTLFLIIILGLICCYKKNKDDSAAQPSDVTYAQIETTNNYKGIYEAVRRPNDVTYSQIKMENFKRHREGDTRFFKVSD
ncbi:sialoadhesin-like [Colossoma macropomum]|uniref:sialoadhesin-like n=1 Tax=Colossoma macropomum TaxID=42526 RepID=UPI001864943D|nr:sialoadhesin-like [Colossoma macropomum]